MKSFIKSIKRQAGLTLVELAVAVAITGIIGLGASIASGQVLNQTAKNNDYTTASRNALNALYWISRDAAMAQSIEGAAGFPQTDNLSLSWAGWDNTTYSANYTVEDGVLQRIYAENGQVSTTCIASYINTGEAMTYCVSYNGTLTLTITCSVGAGDRVVNVTRERKIAARPHI